MRREKFVHKISHETIYKYIYNILNWEKELYKCLPKPKNVRKSRRNRRNKGGIPNLVSISQRPENIEKREELGHFEVDLVVFTSLQSANVTTLVERKSRFVRLVLNKNKTSQVVINGIKNVMAELPENSVKSMTFDRGVEFTRHENLGILTFFCHPGCPWEKGGNENFNGRLRRFLPKNFDYRKLTQKMLDKISEIVNNTPRKCLTL